MKLRKLIAGIMAASLAVSALSVSDFRVSDYSIIQADAESVPGYSDTNTYVADSLINGLVDLETGESSSAGITYSQIKNREYYYETLAEALMEDKGLIVSSEFWNLSTGIISGDLGKVSQKETYEVFLTDYLQFEAASTDSAESELINKSASYENSILKELVKKGIADSEEEVRKLIESSDSLNDPKLVAAMDELGLTKKLNSYAGLLEDIQKVSSSALDYFEALSTALALKEVNDDRVNFLLAMKKRGADNEDFCEAVDEIIETMESSYAEISISAGIDTMKDYAVDTAWGAVKDKIPGMSAVELARDGLDLLFDSDETAANNMRLLMQYTAGQYAHQAMSDACIDYLQNPSEVTAETFNQFLDNFLAYQEYSSDWAKKYITAISEGGLLSNIISDKEAAQFGLDALDSDIDMAQRSSKLIEDYTKLYNNYIDSSSEPDTKMNIPENAVIYGVV